MSHNTRDLSTAGDALLGDRPSSAPTGGSPLPSNRRLVAFARYLATLDHFDVRATREAYRGLHNLGLGIVVVGNPNAGGGR